MSSVVMGFHVIPTEKYGQGVVGVTSEQTV